MNKPAPSQKPAQPVAEKSVAEHLYAANDPIPVPEAIESDSDTAWGLWEDLSDTVPNESDRAFAHTVPADLLPEQEGFKPKKAANA